MPAGVEWLQSVGKVDFTSSISGWRWIIIFILVRSLYDC